MFDVGVVVACCVLCVDCCWLFVVCSVLCVLCCCLSVLRVVVCGSVFDVC